MIAFARSSSALSMLEELDTARPWLHLPSVTSGNWIWRKPLGQSWPPASQSVAPRGLRLGDGGPGTPEATEL